MNSDRAAMACQSFAERLRRLRQEAGQPSLYMLRRLSERLAVPANGQPVLTESTTHDILAGKRRKLPSWAWVAAYVRACHAAREQTGLDPVALGSVEHWHQIWAAAYDACQPGAHAGRDDPADRHLAGRDPAGTPLADPPPASPPPPGRDLASTGSVGTGRASPDPENWPHLGDGSPEYVSEFGPAAQRTETLNRYLRSFGRPGGRLLARAEGGDPAAAYPLGVLLACCGRPHEGLAWLEQAARGGIGDAARLCSRHDRDAAADAAYRLGADSEMAGDMEAALVYYEHAANCDHAEAAYRAGVILTNAGDPWTAGYWLGKAASRGHPDADQHLDDIYDQVRGDMNTPP